MLTPEEFGARLPWKPIAATVRKWARMGRLPGAIRTPGGRWMIPLSAVEFVLVGEAVDGDA